VRQRERTHADLHSITGKHAGCNQPAAVFELPLCVPRSALPEARCVLPERAFAYTPFVFVAKPNAGASRQAVPGGGDLWGDEEHSPGVGAQRAS
jgi:hypothetical protein